MTTNQMLDPQLQLATPNDLGLIQKILQQNHLPSSDSSTRLNTIFLYRCGAEAIGVGGLEQIDAYGLLRSVVVAVSYRGNSHLCLASAICMKRVLKRLSIALTTPHASGEVVILEGPSSSGQTTC